MADKNNEWMPGKENGSRKHSVWNVKSRQWQWLYGCVEDMQKWNEAKTYSILIGPTLAMWKEIRGKLKILPLM